MLVTVAVLMYRLRINAIKAVAGTETMNDRSMSYKTNIVPNDRGSESQVYSVSLFKNHDNKSASSSTVNVIANPERITAISRSTMRQSLHG